MERRGTSHNKLERAGTCQKLLQTSGTKKKTPSWWATNDIDCHAMVLVSVNFYLK